MVETVLGDSWANLFTDYLKEPLGIDSDEVRYVTAPQQNIGVSNPLIAGGLRISALRIRSITLSRNWLGWKFWFPSLDQ